MKTTFKKMISVLLLLALLVTGCSNNTTKTSDSGSVNDNKNDSTVDSGAENVDDVWIGDHELTFFEYTKQPFDDESPVNQAIEEMTGVKLVGTIGKNVTDRMQAYNLMVSSGDMSDIVSHFRDNIFSDAMDGAYIPLQDLIKEHAPNIQALFDEYPEYRQLVTAPDGNIYLIPHIADGEAATGFFIREDWLDNLGLEIPTTVDQYYEVLTAIKNEDANGNGDPNDEIPFFARNVLWGFDRGLIPLWDGHVTFYVDGDEVKYGPMESEFKEAMINIAKWYDEGLIDPEIFTRGGTARDFMLGQDIGGSTHDWFGSTAAYNNQLEEEIPGIAFLPMLPPEGPDGVMREGYGRVLGSDKGTTIASTCKDPVTAIKVIDFFFSEEGRRLMNFGVEGDDYDMIDGAPVFREHVINAEGGVVNHLVYRGAQSEMIAFHQDFQYEKQWLNPIAADGMEMYLEADVIRSAYPYLNYDSEKFSRKSAIMTPIQTLVDEQTQKWVLGVEDVESTWDSFVGKLINLNIEEVLEIENEAYMEYMSN